jgi:hypothetical protein
MGKNTALGILGKIICNYLCQLHLQLLASTNPHWARVVGYGPFFLCVIHKEGLCPSSGYINKLMMMIKKDVQTKFSRAVL